jgi:hypothetical protein
MPRGQRKRGEFLFVVWFEDGARIEWKSSRPQRDADIAAAIREYLVPMIAILEQPETPDAVDPHVGSTPV